MSALERELGEGEADGCSGILVQVNTDDGKVVQAECTQGTRYQSSELLLKIVQTKKKARKKLTGRGGE